MTSKRIRLDDVVRKTGLSRSTIDRVLNERPGVRRETKALVEAALQEMGYVPDALSARRMVARQPVDIFLSEGSNPFFVGIWNGFERALRAMGAEAPDARFCGFDPYEPATLVDALATVRDKTQTVIAVGADTPEVSATIRRLVEDGIRVVVAISDVPDSGRACFVGQDNFLAGRTAGRLMLQSIPPGPGTVASLLGHFQFRHLLDRRSGFEQIVGMERAELAMVTPRAYGTDSAVARGIVETLVQQYDDLKGIYLCGGGQPSLIDALSDLPDPKPVIIGHEATAESRRALETGSYRFVVAHDTEEVARKALRAAMTDAEPENAACDIHIHVLENLPMP